MKTMDAAVETASGPADNDHAVASEWGLTLRRVCSTRHGSVVGIYSGRWKLADYCPDTSRLIVGGAEPRPVATLFDAIMAVVNLSVSGSKNIPSWLRL